MNEWANRSTDLHYRKISCKRQVNGNNKTTTIILKWLNMWLGNELFLRKTHFDFAGRRPSGWVVGPTSTHQVVQRRRRTTWWQRQPLSRLDLVNHRAVTNSLERFYAVRQDLPHAHRCTYTNNVSIFKTNHFKKIFHKSSILCNDSSQFKWWIISKLSWWQFVI